ncbi:MAG: response regulator [Phycisphaeraceae bacterium]|nr:response regulator [Phycisphaeraceae bacterium]
MKRILVIDDDVQIRQLLKLVLEQAGYEVLDAGDGNEGVRLFRADPTDLVITDIIMPEKEGIEIIRELQNDFPTVKIIAISGGGRMAAEDYLKTARRFGVARTFTKPFECKALLEAIQELLSVSVTT